MATDSKDVAGCKGPADAATKAVVVETHDADQLRLQQM